jgi:preprotein translocase subunit SecG
MYLLLTILAVVASVILVLIVLVQNSKGGGLASSFSSSNQIMGVRKTTDFLEKTTWTLIAFIVVCCVFATGVHSGEGVAATSEISEEAADMQQQAATTAAPFDEAAPAE